MARKAPSATVRAYLFAYNAVSMIAWLTILTGTIVNVGHSKTAWEKRLAGGELLLSESASTSAIVAGWEKWIAILSDGRVFAHLDRLIRLVQTAALVEVVNSAFGIVPASLMQTTVQIASRLLLVWPIAFMLPEAVRNEPAYVTMVISWSVTEIIRYGHFAVKSSNIGPIAALEWLRYSAFFVLYITGVYSERVCLRRSLKPANSIDDVFGRRFGSSDATEMLDKFVTPVLGQAISMILTAYIPGFFYMYTHMIGQRRRQLGKKPESTAEPVSAETTQTTGRTGEKSATPAEATKLVGR